MQETESIVGRANRDGANLLRSWFKSLDEAAHRDEKAAYVFVMGSMNEMLKAFDMHISFPEITSLQLAVRHVAHEYLQEAEDYGYSPDICGYVKSDVALQLRGGEHPMGRIPKPNMTVFTNACNTYIKWAEIWERLHKIPICTLDVPGHRQIGVHTQPGQGQFETDRAYVEVQIKELISTLEEVNGKKFDIDKFREHLAYTNQMSQSWARLLELNRCTPSVYNALTDGTIYLGVGNGVSGKKKGADDFANLV